LTRYVIIILMRKKDLVKDISFHRHLLRDFKKGLFYYDMIENGDNILLGFSGGKDSTSLALLLKYYQLTGDKKFTFEAVTIRYGISEVENYKKQVQQIEKYGIKTTVYDTSIFELGKTKINEDSSKCSFFSRMRRGHLTQFARENGFNKIALGHHLDDAAESLLMGIFKNGKIRSLVPIYKNKHNQVIIRPLCLVREKQLAKFARKNEFDVLANEFCPGICFGKPPTARLEMKNLIKELEKTNKNVVQSIAHALSSIDQHSLYAKENLKYFQKKNI
jgi:tRNA 2-thiocytidine biosynthesis protein TtcA